MSDTRKTALYCRSARENDAAIGKQAVIMRNYAKKHGFDNLALYVDNGASGLRFDRPALNRLEIHMAKRLIGTVMVSDISRLSRNYLDIPKWIDSLRHRGIAFVSVEDNITGEMFDEKVILFQRLCEHFERQESAAVFNGG